VGFQESSNQIARPRFLLRCRRSPNACVPHPPQPFLTRRVSSIFATCERLRCAFDITSLLAPRLSVTLPPQSRSQLCGCNVRTGPPALFAFPLPLLTHTSWQTEFGRWFKFGLRNHKCAFNRYPISRNHPIFHFPRLLLHKSARTLLSAVIRCRRPSSHLARIRKAGSRRQTESPRTTES